ncbi:hypothetical protein ACHAO1_006859 [Botrytis cinerea]
MAATTKPNNVMMDNQRKKVVRDLLLGNLKPSRLNKLAPELITMIMENLFNNMIFPHYPDIIKILNVKSEATAFYYTLKTFIKHAKIAEISHRYIDQFPKLLELENHVDGEFKVDIKDRCGKETQLQFMCESFGFRFFELHITDLVLDFSKLNETKLAEFKVALTSDKNYTLKPYFVYLASQIKRLAVKRGQFTSKATKFQIACISQFLRHSKHLIHFGIIDTPSNDKNAFMNDCDDSMCALVRGISSIFDLNSRRIENVFDESDSTSDEASEDDSDVFQKDRWHTLPTENPPVAREVSFRWTATGVLKADVSKIDQLEQTFKERRFGMQKYHGHTEESFLTPSRPSSKTVLYNAGDACVGVSFDICHGCGPGEVILPR